MPEQLIPHNGNYKKLLSYQKAEIKLVNVAKASLQELLEDYEDYLKTRHCRQWEEGSEELEAMRKLGKMHSDAAFFLELAATRPPETIANMCIVLIKQADYLLYRQLQRLKWRVH